MAEPHTTAGALMGAVTIGVTGTVFGAPLDSLLVGLVAAIFVSIWMPAIDSRLKAAAAVMLSGLLAGYGSPVAAGWLAAEQAGLANGSPLRLLLALLIGAVAPTLVPVAVLRLQNMLGGVK